MGRTKHNAARTTYPTCAPLVPQAIRAGDVVFVRNDEGFETTAIVISKAGDRFEGRDWRNVVRSYPVSGVFGQYCKP